MESLTILVLAVVACALTAIELLIPATLRIFSRW